MEATRKSLRSRSLAGLLACMLLVLAAGVMSAVTRPAGAAQDDHMFCESGDRKEKVTYFITIFLGDYAYQSARSKLDFHSYLEDAGKDPDFSSTFCWPGSIYGEDTYEKARRELEDRVRAKQRYPYTDWDIVHTNWKPGYSAPQLPSDVDKGRESGGDGCYFGECPDGTSPAPQTPGQTSQRTLICQTPEGWCEMSTELPLGVPCGCLSLSGPVEGVTVP